MKPELLTGEAQFFNQPSTGVVAAWTERNATRFERKTKSPLLVLDGAVLFTAPFRTWGTSSEVNYTPGNVMTVASGVSVPREGTWAWRRWQDYKNSEAGRNDMNGAKSHLHRYTEHEDGTLTLETGDYDWHGMRVLGLGIQARTIPQRFHDAIIPTTANGETEFRGMLPNNTNTHAIVTTADDELIVATRGQAVDYYQGYTAATVELQTGRNKSPFETYTDAMSKLNSQSELQLTPRSQTQRLGALGIEPDCNSVDFFVLGQVEEDSSVINRGIVNPNRTGEFAPEPNSVWTIPLRRPDTLIGEFHNPRRFLWHGTARLRIVIALASIHGYEETLKMLSRDR